MAGQEHSTWLFFSNHWHVLVVIAREPRCRLRDVAARVGITERTAKAIVRDLAQAGYLTVHKEGRRNTYEVNETAMLRHPLYRDTKIKPILDILRTAPPRDRDQR